MAEIKISDLSIGDSQEGGRKQRAMKQYTTPEQTAKLIELGFEKPKSEVKAEQAEDCAWYNPAYSIGELIALLPTEIRHGGRGFISFLSIAPYIQGWKVAYTHLYIMLAEELVDALYSMLVQLKEDEQERDRRHLCNHAPNR